MISKGGRVIGESLTIRKANRHRRGTQLQFIIDGAISVLTFGQLGITAPRTHKKYCFAGPRTDAENIKADFVAFDRKVAGAAVNFIREMKSRK